MEVQEEDMDQKSVVEVCREGILILSFGCCLESLSDDVTHAG